MNENLVPSEAPPAEAIYMDSVRAHAEKRRLQQLWDKLRHHERMVRVHTATSEAIVSHHREEIARCEALLGIDEYEKEAS